jgi:hypothetical protein
MPVEEVEVYLYSFFDLGTRWVGWSVLHAGHFTPLERKPIPILQETGWALGLGGVPDISMGPGFNPWTIQMLSVNIQREKCGIKKIYIVAMYLCNSMQHLKITTCGPVHT